MRAAGFSAPFTAAPESGAFSHNVMYEHRESSNSLVLRIAEKATPNVQSQFVGTAAAHDSLVVLTADEGTKVTLRRRAW